MTHQYRHLCVRQMKYSILLALEVFTTATRRGPKANQGENARGIRKYSTISSDAVQPGQGAGRPEGDS